MAFTSTLKTMAQERRASWPALQRVLQYRLQSNRNRKNMIKIELNNDELQAVVGLLDAGIKATGLSGVKAAASILAKLEEAVAKANETKETE
jgi:hypothetical protein